MYLSMSDLGRYTSPYTSAPEPISTEAPEPISVEPDPSKVILSKGTTTTSPTDKTLLEKIGLVPTKTGYTPTPKTQPTLTPRPGFPWGWAVLGTVVVGTVVVGGVALVLRGRNSA